MKRNFLRKGLSVLLAAAFVVSSVPATSLTADAAGETEITPDNLNENTKLFDMTGYTAIPEGWSVTSANEVYSDGTYDILKFDIGTVRMGNGYGRDADWVGIKFKMIPESIGDAVLLDADGNKISGYVYANGNKTDDGFWVGDGERSHGGTKTDANGNNRLANYLKTVATGDATLNAGALTLRGIPYATYDECIILLNNETGTVDGYAGDYYTVKTYVKGVHLTTEYYSGHFNGIGGIETGSFYLGANNAYQYYGELQIFGGGVNKASLEEAINSAEQAAYVQARYTEESWNTYAGALANAKKVFANEGATREEVDAAVIALQTAEEGMNLKPAMIADFTFDDEATGFSGGNADAAGTYQLAAVDGRNAVYLNGDNAEFLKVTAKDEGSLLTSVKEMTVSYDAKPDTGATNWVFYAAPNENAQTNLFEHYIGIVQIFNAETTTAERYNNSGGRPENPSAVTGKDWMHVDVVFTKAETILYVNGVEQSRIASNYDLSDILGKNSICQIGKANWGGGEYYKGWLDNYKIYNYALTPEQLNNVPVSSLTVTADGDTAEVAMGETLQLTAAVEPENATYQLSWESLNPEVATVDENGLVTGVAVGEATIKATATDQMGTQTSAEITLTVKKDLATIKAEAVTELESYKNKDDYRADEQAILASYIEAGTKAINAAETEDAVKAALEEAKTSLDGIATDLRLTTTEYEIAMGEAEEVLYSYKEDGGYLTEQDEERIAILEKALTEYTLLTENVDLSSATASELKDIMASVNTLVEKAKADVDALPTAADLTVTGVSIKDGAELAIQVDTTYTLGVDVTGGEKADKTVTWSSDNTAVATVAEDGTVTAVSAGTAIITAQVKENPESGEVVEATITITVEPRKYEVRVKNGEAVEKIGEFEEWTLAKVEAPAAPEGNKFAYWKTSEGKIVCYASNYSFYVMQDVTLVPVYVKDETAVEEQVTILCTASYNKSTKKVSFTSKRSLPVGYTVVSHGVVITDSKGWNNNFNQDAEKLVIGASRTKRSVATTKGRLGTYVARLACTASDTWYGRAYVTYKDKNGEEHTVYSDGVASCQVDVN